VTVDERAPGHDAVVRRRGVIPEPGAPPEVSEPHLILSPEVTAHAREVVSALLDDAAAQGERVVAGVRIFFCTLTLLFWTPLVGDDLARGEWEDAAPIVVAVVGLAASWWILRRLKSGTSYRSLAASIVLDATLVNGMILAFVIGAGEPYFGLPRITGAYVILVAIVTSGIRLSRRAAILGSVVNVGAFAGLALLDVLLDNPTNANIITDYVVFVMLLAVSVAVAFFIAVRTRTLVLTGATKAAEAERARALLGAYVSPEVARATLEDDDPRIGGHAQDVAVLFSDLRSFTQYSEDLDPEDLVAQLNRYFEAMVHAIRAESGVVDKYVGDAIMAVFGVPEAREDDAVRAIRAAQRMQAALVVHNLEREARGQPPFRHGIGVHYGRVVAGNIGTPERTSYTVIGDTVNVASRMEQATKTEGVPVLLSETLVTRARAQLDLEMPAVREVGELAVRGRKEPVTVFTLADGNDADENAATP
jgi:class 3 adenylate cyclase